MADAFSSMRESKFGTGSPLTEMSVREAAQASGSLMFLASLRPDFHRPSDVDVLGQPRLRPIRMKQCQRSRERNANAAAAEELVRMSQRFEIEDKFIGASEADFARKSQQADARFQMKRLGEAVSRSTATEERVRALKQTMQKFLRSHGTESERELKRAFTVADVDASGELCYPEFQEAVRNYGLRQLSCGALRTLFDSFDGDKSGQISHAEFEASLRESPEPGPPPGARGGPLQRPPASEPRRCGFEASPPQLRLGRLLVGVAYQAEVRIINTGDVDLRLAVKVAGPDGKRAANPAHIVERPRGPLAPGMRARVVVEIVVRCEGPFRLDVRIASETQVVDVPLTADFHRRSTTRVPTSAATALMTADAADAGFDGGDDDYGTIVTAPASPGAGYSIRRGSAVTFDASAFASGSLSASGSLYAEERSSRLPSYVRRVSTAPAPLRALVSQETFLVLGAARAASESVWPGLPEQWDAMQRQTAQADAALKAMPALAGCPAADRRSAAVRFKRFKAPAGKALFIQGDASAVRRMLFLAKGAADVYVRDLVTGDDAHVLTLHAPFYVGEGALDAGNAAPTATVLAASAIEGFQLAGHEVDGLVERGNCAIALIRREMLQRAFERDCALSGGLLLCNFEDATFVEALLDYTRLETRHEIKARFTFRQLAYAKTCRAKLEVADDHDKRLRFDECWQLCDGILRDFIRDPETPESRKIRSVLGPLVDDDCARAILARRHAARVSSDVSGLADVYAPLQANVLVVLDRAVLANFVHSTQYKTWLALKFPVPASPRAAPQPRNAGRARVNSIDYDLPELRADAPARRAPSKDSSVGKRVGESMFASQPRAGTAAARARDAAATQSRALATLQAQGASQDDSSDDDGPAARPAARR
ncbi:hypothetical protein M885DRAFT_559526 [Pelagophyceae sp. CCMP2097]|nr:hypothetical protein M885DRAFT_559526 [Pelagophyceae sp. CCMP2097]